MHSSEGHFITNVWREISIHFFFGRSTIFYCPATVIDTDLNLSYDLIYLSKATITFPRIDWNVACAGFTSKIGKLCPCFGYHTCRQNVSKKTDTKWNSSTFYGTVPQFVEQRPKMWNRSCKRVSVPQIVEQRAKFEHFKFSRILIITSRKPVHRTGIQRVHHFERASPHRCYGNV